MIVDNKYNSLRTGHNFVSNLQANWFENFDCLYDYNFSIISYKNYVFGFDDRVQMNLTR